ncbi:hypothetical protein C2869_00600 [Saccharobesus litoralis]|uniref:Response regulatory domain-containing protein n=1 Tax=Saccharobesus litoralis TaxID=2172099 RepID=A0A2S0VLF4_9ALTE|nr:response regulator [Saccharobesus litoralis]AWB65031.1 hypothetical protein C2869_00600 [Saccharobesus litoralis]
MKRDVILIEDDSDEVYFFTEACASIKPSLNLLTFTNGVDFLSYTTKNDLNNCLIFIDVNMPLVDGFSLMTNLKQKGLTKNNKLYIYTITDCDKARQQASEVGADGYIVKPDTCEAISHLIESKLAEMDH